MATSIATELEYIPLPDGGAGCGPRRLEGRGQGRRQADLERPPVARPPAAGDPAVRTSALSQRRQPRRRSAPGIPPRGQTPVQSRRRHLRRRLPCRGRASCWCCSAPSSSCCSSAACRPSARSARASLVRPTGTRCNEVFGAARADLRHRRHLGAGADLGGADGLRHRVLPDRAGAAWLRRPVGTAIELLAAVPSIIYGMWGFFVIVPLMAQYVQPALIDTFDGIPADRLPVRRPALRHRHPHRRADPGGHDHAVHRRHDARRVRDGAAGLQGIAPTASAAPPGR